MRKITIGVSIAAIVVALTALLAVELWRWHSHTVRAAETHAVSLTHVLAGYVGEAFAASDAALRQLAAHSIRVGGPSAPASDWTAAIEAADTSIPAITSISILDREGVVRHSTQPQLVGQPRGDDVVFQRVRASAGEEITVDVPARSLREPAIYVLPIGRALADRNGQFIGAAIATFVPAELRSLFRTVGIDEHGVVWIFHPAGVVVFREPSPDSVIGLPAVGNPIFEAAAAGAESGTLHDGTGPGSRPAISAYRRILHPPLVVALSLDRREALGGWRQVAIGSMSLFGISSVLLVALVGVLFRQIDAGTKLQAALGQAQRLENERLQAANRLLTSALDREQAARREADAANAVKDQFLMTISHELRTPLTAIYGWATMLAKGGVAELQRDAAVRTIERNARVQMRLIDDLLDASRAMSGRLSLDPRPVDAAAVVRDAVGSIRPASAAKAIALKSTIQVDPCELIADPDRLQQIVWNLLSNAVKFTPNGGTVSVDLARRGDMVEIAVSDTGRGIAPEFLPHVFDRFRQEEGGTKRRHGGLGLGLAIVRSLVELHGGSVEVASPGPDAGSTFTVRLPALMAPPFDGRDHGGDRLREDSGESADASPTAERPARQRADQPWAASLAGTRVLVVDDDETSRVLFGAALRTAGADAHTAASADAALRMLAREPYDVLVADIEMPEKDGFELVSEALAMTARAGRPLATIAVTAYARPEDEARSLAAGFHRHLPKPVDPAALVGAVRDLRPERPSSGRP